MHSVRSIALQFLLQGDIRLRLYKCRLFRARMTKTRWLLSLHGKKVRFLPMAAWRSESVQCPHPSPWSIVLTLACALRYPHVLHSPGGQIVSGEDDEDDAPAPTVVSQKSAVSAQPPQHQQQSPEPLAPQVTDTAGLARQVSAVAASGGGQGEGPSAANTPDNVANLPVTASALGTLASRPAQRASVKAAATESYDCLIHGCGCSITI